MKRRILAYTLALLAFAAATGGSPPLLAQDDACPLEGASIKITATTTVGEGYAGGDQPVFEPAYTAEIVEPNDRAGETVTIVSIVRRPSGIPGGGVILDPTPLEVEQTYSVKSCSQGEVGFDYWLVEAGQPSPLLPKVQWKVVGLDCEPNKRWELDTTMEFQESVGSLQRFKNYDEFTGETEAEKAANNPYGWSADTWYDDWDPFSRTRRATWVEEDGVLTETEPYSTVPEYLPADAQMEIGATILLNGIQFVVEDRVRWATAMGRRGGDTMYAWKLVNEEAIEGENSVTAAGDLDVRYDEERGVLVSYARTEALYGELSPAATAEAGATPAATDTGEVFLGYRLKSMYIDYPELGGMRVLYVPSQETCNSLARERPNPSSGDSDGDGIADSSDNCPNDINRGQYDLDEDGIGDVCDPLDAVVDSGWEYGDAYPEGSDIVGGGLQHDGSTLTFTMKLRTLPTEPDGVTYGVYLDTDHSADTGLPLGGMGADYALHIEYIDYYGDYMWMCGSTSWAERGQTIASSCPEGTVGGDTLTLSIPVEDIGGLDWRLNYAFYATGYDFPLRAEASSFHDLMPDLGGHFAFLREEQIVPESPRVVWFAASEQRAYGQNFIDILHADGHAYVPLTKVGIDLYDDQGTLVDTLVATDGTYSNCLDPFASDSPELEDCSLDFFKPWREGGPANQGFVFDTFEHRPGLSQAIYVDGKYRVTATLEDAAGVVSTAEQTLIVDNHDDPPEITVHYPADGASVGDSFNAFFSAEADDIADPYSYDHLQELKDRLAGTGSLPVIDQVNAVELSIEFEDGEKYYGFRGWYDQETSTATEIAEDYQDTPERNPDFGWGYHFYLPFSGHQGEAATITAKAVKESGITGTAYLNVTVDHCETEDSLTYCQDSDNDGLKASEDCDDQHGDVTVKKGGDDDSDGVTNCDDVCPLTSGTDDWEGCPDLFAYIDGLGTDFCHPVGRCSYGVSKADLASCTTSTTLDCSVEIASETCPEACATGAGCSACAVEAYDIMKELKCDIWDNVNAAYEGQPEQLGSALLHSILLILDIANDVPIAGIPARAITAVMCVNQGTEVGDAVIEWLLRNTVVRALRWAGNGIVSFARSPVELNAYDSEGRHVGPDENGDPEAEIPGALYIRDEGIKVLWLPDATQTYDLEVSGTGSGEYALTTVRSDEQGVLTVEYPELEVSAASEATVSLSPESRFALSVDADGDGQTDETVRPLSMEMDSDLDGVPNSVDRCPDTPADVEVNGFGCEPGALRQPDWRSVGRELSFYEAAGQMSLASAEDWESDATWQSSGDVNVVEDPKGSYGKVAELSVKGYARGDETASILKKVVVPDGADIVAIPLATALNGDVSETDSEAGVVVKVEGGRDVTTSFSHVWETGLAARYILAFADVSESRGKEVDLSITLQQPDACAGSDCTHDIDLYVGDLFFASLPEVCTTDADGDHLLLDYPDDPTPRDVDRCDAGEPFYFQEVEYGPSNEYGKGSDTHTIDLEMPAGATLDRVGLYYGPQITRFSVNGEEIDPQRVAQAYPVASSTYVGVDSPLKYSLINNNTRLLESYLQEGQNTIAVEVKADNDWDERPFYFYARLKVPSTEQGAGSAQEEGGGGGIGWLLPIVAIAAAAGVAIVGGLIFVRRRRRARAT